MQTFTIPLFPLPGLVLFPRTMIPLHIFEPRYVKMITDALAGERRIATGNLRAGWQKDYFGSPRIYRTITVARILHEEKLPGNQFNILLEGIERAQVVDELAHKSYRVVRATSVVDSMPADDMSAIREASRRMVSMAEQLAAHMPEHKSTLTNLENQHLHPAIIADQVASVLVKDAYERQSLLEQRSVLRRLELVNVQLQAMLSRELDPQYQHWLDERK